jgi:hypothetical protein
MSAEKQASAEVVSTYALLGRGIHLREIQRFLDAGNVDPHAETIPAPPSADAGAADPPEYTRDTRPCPPPSLLDLRERSPEQWNTIAELVEK